MSKDMRKYPKGLKKLTVIKLRQYSEGERDMDTRKMALELRLAHWWSVLQSRKESGLSIRYWCRENGIGEKRYYYWQRKIREATCRKLLATETEADNKSLVPSGWAICEFTKSKTLASTVTVEIGKFRVSVGSDTSSAHLEKICRVLMSLC